MNLFIRVLFFFEDGSMLALSDLRKFAKIELHNEKPKLNIGPDALKVSFNDFLKKISKEKGKIKQVLMNQEIVSGIGNIYADEVLWESKVHPLKKACSLDVDEYKKIFNSVKRILKLSIKRGGDSMSDYRLINGEKGGYQKMHKVYRRENSGCFFCKEKIKRIKIGNRSSHVCPKCQPF